ncbi:DUF924 domain-containing protein [Motilimonas cestriensis]|uniref:DUF924 domain-containing protein n=1 Tax=Motilimonas cestriensis TaxID=2742685 RepID=A0ABS8WCG8_9GAMM|nr:DUF924 family protein [Motilimonas cestriensis]MCE2595234.1 DUF924 domain-containing protein [Motilimonas cestriensis]
MNTNEYESVLTYWFGDLRDGLSDALHRNRWFQGGESVDAEIKAKFAALHQGIVAGEYAHWLKQDLGILATVIVLDQFSRTLFRGSKTAFAYDGQALALAKEAVARGIDLRLPLDYRLFLYLPYEHSENMQDQEQCLALMQGMLEDAHSLEAQQLVQQYLQFAEDHYAIIRRFGRYPHRNAVLGRPSRQIEVRYLADEPARFGQ